MPSASIGRGGRESHPKLMSGSVGRRTRLAWRWATVNGGVLLIAAAVARVEEHVHSATGSDAAAALTCTAVLYGSVFSACALNLRGRRSISGRPHSQAKRITLTSILAHPLGSALERYVHALASLPAAEPSTPTMPRAVNETTGTGMPVSTMLGTPTDGAAVAFASAVWWFAILAIRLLAFEICFDGLFYIAHRSVHAVPRLYAAVHKLHHSHTHDVRLLSSFQMTAADVVLTHTLPVLGALSLVPMAPGVELSIAKTYLLFQELYGHAGVEHRGRCFGPAPFIVTSLGIDLCADDHRRHHIQASVNCMPLPSSPSNAFLSDPCQSEAAHPVPCGLQSQSASHSGTSFLAPGAMAQSGWTE